MQEARESHTHCVICGADDPLGLGLEFNFEKDGSVSVFFRDGSRFQGYQNQLHGGIISTLFDAAMTHCLFSSGITAVTGELLMRFLHPVTTDLPVSVNARIKASHSPLYIIEAELVQCGRPMAKARGKFMEVNPPMAEDMELLRSGNSSI